MNNFSDMELAPERIVSLVPSITESLFDLGLGDKLVGVTDYCVYPKGNVERLIKVGGPKNVNIEKIKSLHPDLVIANQEENDESDINQLKNEDINIFVFFPLTVQGALDDLWRLAELCHQERAIWVMKNLQDNLDWLKLSENEVPKFKYFCPIWQQINNKNEIEWMTFNQNTYMSDLLSIWGGVNIFADMVNEKAFNEAGKRYFYVNAEQISSRHPDIVILPDEPYAFSEKDRSEILKILSNRISIEDDKVILIDGSLITWHGTRFAKAIQNIPTLLNI